MKKAFSILKRRWRDVLGLFLFAGSVSFLAFAEPLCFVRLGASLYSSFFRFVSYSSGGRTLLSPLLSFYGSDSLSSGGALSGWDLSVYWLLQGESLPWALWLSSLTDAVDLIVRILMGLFAVYLLFRVFVSIELRPSKSPRGYSKAGMGALRFRFHLIPKAIACVRDYCLWLFRSFWLKPMVIVLLISLSVPSILIDFASFYFYFMVSFDFVGLLDLLWAFVVTLFGSFSWVPLWLWPIVAYFAFRFFRSYFADVRLRSFLKRDSDFVANNCGVFTLTLGKMRDGKDTVQESFVMHRESLYRDSLQNTMCELRSYFPFFDFEGLERAIIKGMAFGNAQNQLRANGQKVPLSEGEVHNMQQASDLGLSLINKDMAPYWNGSVYVSLPKVVSEYCKAFFVYGYDASLIVGNIPYRCDKVWVSHGFSPLWDDDSLKRLKSYPVKSYMTHNVRYDALRFGRKMDPSSDWCDSLGPGIWTFTEYGKEYGNQLTNMSVKASDPTSNSKNDMTDYTFKVGGHVANIWHVNYFSVFANEQRCGSLSGNLVDLAESIIVPDSRCIKKGVALRFWWLEPMVHDFFYSLIMPFILKYRNARGDFDLFYCLSLIVLDESVRRNVYAQNRYGFSKRTLHISTSGVDGNLSPVGDEPYWIVNCVDFADRFQSDCMGDFLNGKKLQATKGLFDLPEFKGLMPSKAEWDFQGSHLVSDLEDPLASGRFGQSRDGIAGGEAGNGGPAV